MSTIHPHLWVLLSIFFPLVMAGPMIPGPTDPSLVRAPYVQNVTQTSATIAWATLEGGPAEVRFGVGDTLAQRAPAEFLIAGGRTYYAAVLTGLAPEQRYTYQAWRGSQSATPPQTFTTATAGETFSFAVTGDSRTASAGAVAIAAGMKGKQPAFVLHTGDLTTHGTIAEHDTDVFAVYRDLLSFAPLYPALGNHDLGVDPPAPYLQAFYLPENGPEGLAERIYAFDWGDAHFVSLDVDTPFDAGSPQYSWLAADLAASRQRWKFVILHRPPYSSGAHGSDLAVRRTLGPLFEGGGVDVVFAGHDHHYERTVPLVNEQAPGPGQRGVVYFVAGGGGAPLYGVGANAWTAFSASRYSFIAADVRGCSLALTAIDDTGQPFDAVTLDKCPLAWTQVNTPGFGEHAGPYTGQEAFDLTVFKDQLYLGMEGRACARIWRSNAGVAAPASQEDWEQVVANGFDGTTDCAAMPPTTDNDHIDSLAPFGGFLYASTAMQTADKRGTQVWRSATGDGGSWERVNQPGFGQQSNENFKDMIAFGDLLCGGTGNGGGSGMAPGAQVWCTDGVTRDGQDPARLLWRQQNINGFGDPNNIKIWSSAEYSGALYFGMEARPVDGTAQPGSIWRTRGVDDPGAWEKVFSPTDVGLGGNVSRVDLLEGYGDALYIGFALPGQGAQIWRSSSGDRGSWQRSSGGGFGAHTTGRFISDAAVAAGDGLYVATFDEQQGAAVWRTRGGATWEQVGPTGFGSPTNFAAELTLFGGDVYAWTSNYTAGQGVWRGEGVP